LGLSRATLHRQRSPKVRRTAIRTPPLKLDAAEQAAVLGERMSPRFVDRAPQQIYAVLLDEGRYLCSVRTMYRLLAAQKAVRERREQRVHPVYARPELLAEAPNQLWSWDITKLKTTVKWTYVYLYVVLDVYSRYVVGWLLSTRESAALARERVEQTALREAVLKDQLTLHADRGAPMRSKTLAERLVDLGIEARFSRPQQSNDNPYSESLFKTTKYPGFSRLLCRHRSCPPRHHAVLRARQPPSSPHRHRPDDTCRRPSRSRTAHHRRACTDPGRRL
jgi:putative transposase